MIVFGQILDTVSICNGDSVYLFNNWEAQTGNYTDGVDITTLIVNPTPTLTGSFILNGNATQTIANTYQLTQASGNQSGSAWNSVTLNLSQPFSFDVDVFLGYNNGGADGLAFLLQQVSTSVGTSGGGLGYQGILPSFAVEFDTWQNSSDPSYDHLAVQKNGDLNHNGANNLVPFLGFPPGNSNIEDGLWHNVVFSWDPSTYNFKVVYDGVTLVNYTNNIVASIFGNNPNVYWGFTAATGGANNIQQFRVNSLGVQLSDITMCYSDTIQIDPQVNTSLYSYLWTPNYDISNDTIPSPVFFPDTSTTYYLEITNTYGCSQIDSITIFIDTTNVTNINSVSSFCLGDNPINLNFAIPIGGIYTGIGVANNIFTPDINTIGTNIITYNYSSLNGCSGYTIQNISVSEPTSSYINLIKCDTYTWGVNNQTYLMSGTYVDISTNSDGCTHSETLNLTINNSTSNTTNQTTCDTYTWGVNNQTYLMSGTYVDISTNSDGCTHTEALNLTINNSTSNTTNQTTCYSYTWAANNQTFTSSGTYIDVSTNASGCPHTETLNLTINNSTSNTSNLIECDTYTWAINGNTYTAGGTYIDVSIDTLTGCPHTETLNLSINNSTSNTINLIECDSYTWFVNGNTYTTSGTYIDVSTNASGCPHTETLNLSINNSTSNTTNQTTCDTYTWVVNNQTYTMSGTYTEISTNAAGCSHTETLNLVVGYSDEIDVIIAENNISCFGYNDGSINLIPNGGTPPFQYSWDNGANSQNINALSAGNYSFSFTDSNGCELDSLATINEANQIFLDFIATSPICRYDETILSINISSSTSNIYTVSLLDSILKSFVIDTNGLLIPQGVPIILSPNFSGKVYIVSLTDTGGCTGIYNDEVYIEVKQPPQLNINQEDICIGSQSFTLNNATPNGGIYSINDELTNYFDVENLGPGMYNIGYTYTDPITSCSNQINEVITISEFPKAGMLLSPQPTDIENPNIYFRDNSNETVLYSKWNLGDGTIINNEQDFWHTYQDTGTYSIKYHITNTFGCTDSITGKIIINPIYSVFIPNSFTPNNDGDNDYFYPSIIGENGYAMKIYNRWGEIIYNQDNGTWDGNINNNAAQHGFYSYSILVNDFKNKPFIYTGIVNLIK